MNDMPNENKYRIAVMILAVVVVALAIVVFTLSNGSVSTPQNLLTSGTSTTGEPSGAAGPATSSAQQGAGSKTGGTKPSAVTGFTIHLLTPIADQTWTFAQQNIISWDRAAGVSGQIMLLDATTKELVGVIISQTGPNQTSYAWNTRDIFLSRTNPLKKTVTPGTYLIRVAFDGNNLSSITSGAVTIAQ